jgi:hypothetical protein
LAEGAEFCFDLSVQATQVDYTVSSPELIQRGARRVGLG